MVTFEKDLGDIPQGILQIIYFDMEYALKIPIDPFTRRLKIHKSCGCTSVGYDNNKKQVSIKYKPKAVPIHLEKQGYYESKKVITIFHNDGKRQIPHKFIITARVFKSKK